MTVTATGCGRLAGRGAGSGTQRVRGRVRYVRIDPGAWTSRSRAQSDQQRVLNRARAISLIKACDRVTEEIAPRVRGRVATFARHPENPRPHRPTHGRTCIGSSPGWRVPIFRRRCGCRGPGRSPRWPTNGAGRASATAHRSRRHATLVLTQPQRAACDSAARRTKCWLRSDDSPTPAARRRVCQRSTSATVVVSDEHAHFPHARFALAKCRHVGDPVN